MAYRADAGHPYVRQHRRCAAPESVCRHPRKQSGRRNGAVAAPIARRRFRRNQDVVYIPRIVITSGEPAGVGPDACVALAQTDWETDLVVAADAALLPAPAAALELPLAVERYDLRRPPKPHRAGTLQVMHIPTSCA